MATKIRMKRMGAKKAPFYRIVVADSRSPRDGRFIEELGYYDPLKKPSVIKVDVEKARDWLSKGAQVSETVKSLFQKSGVYEKTAEQGQE
ncbi:MAG: 30S ribosomal protein S16 [Firmicutes bacterium]|nr:30S ribosomal protein S16 [Bacillota bacterium]